MDESSFAAVASGMMSDPPRLTSADWHRLIDEGVIGEGDAVELIDGRPLRKGNGVYVFSPDQVRRAAELGIHLGPSWFDVILERDDLRAEMARLLTGPPDSR